MDARDLLLPLLDVDFGTSSISLDCLRGILKNFASVEFRESLAKLEAKDSNAIVKNLFRIPFLEEEMIQEDQKQERDSWMLSVLALRLLYNVLAAEGILDHLSSFPLSNWRKLLRILPLNVEVTACLSKAAPIIHKHFTLDSEYAPLHEDLAVLFSELPEYADRSFMTVFFMWFFREDAGFLAECSGSMDLTSFESVLKVMDTLLDMPDHGKSLEIHFNNVRFVQLFVVSIVQDSSKHSDHRLLARILELCLATITNALVYKPYTEETNFKVDESDVLRVVCDIFEAVCDCDAQQLMKEQESIIKGSEGDGPARPSPKPIQRRILLESVAKLAANFEEIDAKLLADLRTSSLKALGAFANAKEEYAQLIADRNLVLLILSCARVTSEAPFQMQLAITTLKILCRHPKNQQALFEIEQNPSGAIDHAKLLAELGLKAVIDNDSGKLKLEKL